MKFNRWSLLFLCLVISILIINIYGTSYGDAKGSRLISFDLDERLFIRTELGDDWEIVAQPGIGEVVISKLPEKYKSEGEYQPVFMWAGGVVGALIGAGAVMNKGGGVGAASAGGFIGALAGYLPDLVINSYLYNNISVGWIEEKRLERIDLNDGNKLVLLREEANIYNTPYGSIVAKIEKGEYRKIIDERKTPDGKWDKIKIRDEPVYRRYKIVAQSGWLKAEKLNPFDSNIGDCAVVNEHSMLYDKPLPPASYHDWLKKGSRVEISDKRDNIEYSGAQKWFNGRWYEIRAEKIRADVNSG